MLAVQGAGQLARQVVRRRELGVRRAGWAAVRVGVGYLPAPGRAGRRLELIAHSVSCRATSAGVDLGVPRVLGLGVYLCSRLGGVKCRRPVADGWPSGVAKARVPGGERLIRVPRRTLVP